MLNFIYVEPKQAYQTKIDFNLIGMTLCNCVLLYAQYVPKRINLFVVSSNKIVMLFSNAFF